MKRTVLLVALLASFCNRPADAVVWADPEAEPPTEMTGPMQCVGRLRYTRLKVFGGSCVWIGDRWVLTSRHGVQGWAPGSLWVDFPGYGKPRYRVKVVHLPPDETVDLALLELSQPLAFETPTPLATEPSAVGAPLLLGGFGFAGVAGKPTSTGKFHCGTNEVTSVSEREARFVLDAATTQRPREALPAMFDSGSPVFEVRDEKTYLVGLTVRVSHGTNPTVGDQATMTLVAPLREWLRETMNSSQKE